MYLCNKQEPKGGSVRLDSGDHTFWILRYRGTYNQPKTVHVIPLLLYNQLKSSNTNDFNVENYMMICERKSDTKITCYYDSNVRSGPDKDYVCDIMDSNTITGDLDGE